MPLINSWLLDDDGNDLIQYKLENWDSKVYKLPRTKVKSWINRVEDDINLHSSGIYFLIYEFESKIDEIYVGESRDIIKRLNEHIKKVV